jgi:hypothetical protein
MLSSFSPGSAHVFAASAQLDYLPAGIRGSGQQQKMTAAGDDAGARPPTAAAARPVCKTVAVSPVGG